MVNQGNRNPFAPAGGGGFNLNHLLRGMGHTMLSSGNPFMMGIGALSSILGAAGLGASPVTTVTNAEIGGQNPTNLTPQPQLGGKTEPPQKPEVGQQAPPPGDEPEKTHNQEEESVEGEHTDSPASLEGQEGTQSQVPSPDQAQQQMFSPEIVAMLQSIGLM